MGPVPIVMCGKFAEHAANFSKMMMPEYEVVHHFQSAQEAVKNMPLVLSGQPVKSASGVGTNNSASSPQIPQAMFVGGGFSDAEIDEMLQVPEAKQIPWIAADPEGKNMVQAIGLDAAMKGIVERAKQKFKEIGVVEGRRGEMGLHRY